MFATGQSFGLLCRPSRIHQPKSQIFGPAQIQTRGIRCTEEIAAVVVDLSLPDSEGIKTFTRLYAAEAHRTTS